MNQPSTSIELSDFTDIPIGPSTPQLNLPYPYLLEGSRADYIKYAVSLFQASVKGNWRAAKVILDEKPELICFAITETYETILHIAASAKSTLSAVRFVESLINYMRAEDLELQNIDGYTALALAASVGNLIMAKFMLRKNPRLTDIPVHYSKMPLYLAAAYAKPEMTKYLYVISDTMTGDIWTLENQGWILQKCIDADIFHVALHILTHRKELLARRRLVTDVLLALARKTYAFRQPKQHIIRRIIKSRQAEREIEALLVLKEVWQHVSIMPKSDIDDIILGPPLKMENVMEYPSHVLFVAAKSGNTMFIIEIIRSYPELLWKQNGKGQTIFHVAIKYRHTEIYNLLYEIGSMKDHITRITDKKGNNMLHLVGKYSDLRQFGLVSGVALQMQRELLWFMEVMQMIPTNYTHKMNKDGDMPHELFTKTHAQLVTKGEEWMKYTASQCMVVATLIATMVFAAAFALPGGYNQDTGIPYFRQKPSLIVFVISDAVALISSSTSVLMFLSILTSRYAEIDFLKSLPRKLMFALATLFLSIVTMMIAFSASFFVLYNKDLQWMPIIVTSLAGIPVILFAIVQFRLLGDVFYSTYQSRYLFKPKKGMLY